MKVLVIGGGGREHSLVWKLKQSPRVEKIWCAPGNGGIGGEAECVPVDTGDVPALVAIAEGLGPDLTIVGPELPLVNGVGDAFRSRSWPIVAPSRQALYYGGRLGQTQGERERQKPARAASRRGNLQKLMIWPHQAAR